MVLRFYRFNHRKDKFMKQNTRTQICFQCPYCNSFNTVINKLRVTPLASHDGFYFLDIDFHCKDCNKIFSKKFTAPAPHAFREEIDTIVNATPNLEKLRISLVLESPDWT